MKVLVTGANGFVGSALCPYLVSQGHEVIPVVRRPTGIFHEHIVHNEISLENALEGCDCVVHLAARVHLMWGQEKDILSRFRSDNVDATIGLARQAFKAGVRRFVFMSTIKVNGELTNPGCRFAPEDLPAPYDAYSISKFEAEQKLIDLSKEIGLEIVIIRSPLVYGPGVKGNFETIIRWVKREIPLPLGAVDNSRSMISLCNLVAFTSLCANRQASPNAKGQIFLVSDGIDISTTELLYKVAKSYGCKIRLYSVNSDLLRVSFKLLGMSTFADRLLGSLALDDKKAREMLRWKPIISMDEQLQKMAIYDAVS